MTGTRAAGSNSKPSDAGLEGRVGGAIPDGVPEVAAELATALLEGGRLSAAEVYGALDLHGYGVSDRAFRRYAATVRRGEPPAGHRDPEAVASTIVDYLLGVHGREVATRVLIALAVSVKLLPAGGEGG